jgi:hypothetical protein
MKAGEALRSSADSAAAQMAIRRAAAGAMVPVVSTKTRGGKGRHTRTDSAPIPLPMRLHRTFQPRVERGTTTRLKDAHSRPPPRRRTDAARSVCKNQAPTANMNAWPPLAGCLLPAASRTTGTTRTAVKDGDYAPTVSGTVLTAPALRLATPAQLEGQPRALLDPIRLDGTHEAIRASPRALRSPKTPSFPWGWHDLRG